MKIFHMNSFERNAEKDKTTALILTILIHIGIFATIYFLGNPSKSDTPTNQIKVETPMVKPSQKNLIRQYKIYGRFIDSINVIF
jgi:hypothetical protein